MIFLMGRTKIDFQLGSGISKRKKNISEKKNSNLSETMSSILVGEMLCVGNSYGSTQIKMED